jgi:hypothetical protein
VDEFDRKDQEDKKCKDEYEESIYRASKLIHSFKYKDGLDICLQMLEKDYNNYEAHHLLMKTFSELGSRNELVKACSHQLKEIMFEKEKFTM